MSLTSPGGNASSPAATRSHIAPRVLIRESFTRHWVRYALGFFLLATTNLLAVSLPWLLKGAIEAVQAADKTALATASVLMVAVALSQAIVRTLSRLAILGAGRHVTYELRGRLFHHLQRLPLTYYAGQSTGDITSRAINDMLLVRSFFGFGLMNLANTCLVYVTVLVMMLAMDVRLSLYAIAPYPLFMFAVNRVARKIYGRTLEVQNQMAALTVKAQENISAISLIKTFAREPAEACAWSELSAEYLRRTLRLARNRAALIPLMGAMGAMGTLVVVGFGGAAVIQGRLSLGDFVAFSAYLAYLIWPTLAFGWILNTFQRGSAALARISQILSEPTEDRQMPEEWMDRPLDGSIVFRNLTFSHTDASEGIPHLKNLDLTIPAGSSLGIVGKVGAGKTTLVNMLPRVLSPPENTVLIDGEDVTQIPLARLRHDIALVPQEAFLFSRTLHENITLTPRTFTQQDVERAVRASRLWAELRQLPAGLKTVIGERGFTLSGGQRQRATIARALLTGSHILILDDALSSLDAEVEHDVVSAIREHSARRTTIIISHRLATLSWADQIIVMDKGAIVERGTHDELLAADGLYATIARRQSLADQIEEF